MPDLLEEAKRLSEAATEGPWAWSGNVLDGPTFDLTVIEVRDMPEHAYPEMQTGELQVSAEDSEFIARARTLIPELVERVEQAERERDEALLQIEAEAPVLGRCPHGVDLDREFCPKGCRV